MGIKKAPSMGAVENGAVTDVEDKHSFHNDIFYVKLVGDNVCHLLELPDVEILQVPKMGTWRKLL